MKKFNLLLVALLGLTIGLTSCDPTIENPTISVLSEITIDLNFMEVEVLTGTILIDEKDEFVSVTFTSNFENDPSTEITFSDLTEKSCIFSLTAEELNAKEGMTDVVITVKTTKATIDVTKTVNVIINPVIIPETPLVEDAFEWYRKGGNGQGLDKFGLEWTANLRDVMCVIRPLAGTKLVTLTDKFGDITTLEALKAKVDEAEPEVDFRGVSTVPASEDYDFVLATKVGEGEDAEYFLINVIHATVTTVDGVAITITGNYKTVAPMIAK